MSKRNKRRKQDHVWSPVITVLKDGFLGGLLLIAISHGVHVFSKSLENERIAREEVLKQFTDAKNILSENIVACKRGGQISSASAQKMLEGRRRLIQFSVVNKQLLRSNDYLYVIQYTRFLDSARIKNLCAMKKQDLDLLLNQANDLEIKLRIKKLNN